MSLMTAVQANEYVKSHGVMTSKGQVRLTRPLVVFKKVFTNARPGTGGDRRYQGIANLVIPVGATVNLCDVASRCKKMRASQAYCHSIVRFRELYRIVKPTKLTSAISIHDSWFKYIPGVRRGSKLTTADFMNLTLNHERKHPAFKTCKLVPRDPFSRSKEPCESGIHFFVELQTAKDY